MKTDITALIKTFGLVIVVFILGCSASQPPAYQKDRAPEDRTQYSGAEGLTQQQKDQSYLMDKELSEQCQEAKIDLAIAKTDNKVADIKRSEAIIADSCL